MLTCRQMTEIVTAYAEGKLSFGDRLRFHMHLGMCRHCRRYVRQVKATVRALPHVPVEPPPAAVRDELLARFRSWAPGTAGGE